MRVLIGSDLSNVDEEKAAERSGVELQGPRRSIKPDALANGNKKREQFDQN
ncbi:Hypothetical predicted protein [Olea europaea subsp. europaea]|uniref:Uncharacterized protein n=1 Tax=Olea europaea subsp. europaea TaxID=158383 RepID=A0A8S0P802_OLEEU|nr:Hypothetical predicted protein [Olea europaea subsp. europaea]